MIPVKTQPRFKCDFCKKRSTKAVIAKHESRCFRNPNRFCDNCKNTGVQEYDEGDFTVEVACHYCAKFDPKVLKDIEEYEKKHCQD